MLMQDVLVFNFFSDSPSAAKWRTLYGYMAEQGLLTPAQAASPRYAAPVFDAKRHAALRTELKQLYVLLTRAKTSLLIFEDR